MPVLQAYSISGQIIEKARWEVESFRDLHMEDMLQVSIPSKDPDLLLWLNKHQSRELGLIKEKNKKSYFVVLSFRIARFRHMVEEGKLTIDSMAQVYPMNRDIELVLLYIIDPSKSDPRFKNILMKTKTEATI